MSLSSGVTSTSRADEEIAPGRADFLGKRARQTNGGVGLGDGLSQRTAGNGAKKRHADRRDFGAVVEPFKHKLLHQGADRNPGFVTKSVQSFELGRCHFDVDILVGLLAVSARTTHRPMAVFAIHSVTTKINIIRSL